MRGLMMAAPMALALVACGGDKDGSGDSAAGGGDYADEVAAVESAISGFEGWDQPVPGIVASGNGHPQFVQNWANDVAVDTINAAGGGDMPDGAILVKQGYNDADGTDLGNLTVMWKTDGDWFWVAFNPAGDAVASGYTADVQQQCVSCHEANAEQQDLVITYAPW